MYFSNQELEELQKTHREVFDKYMHLVLSYQTREYKDSRAREYAVHGFSRRVKTLARCIDNVFKIMPPDCANLPSIDDRDDAQINIQAFVFNLFGSIDNLAWIWVLEKGLTKNGSPFPKREVGLGNNLIRSSFSTEFRDYLNGLNGWFDHLHDFRHALAHRIPLYIPPYTIPKAKEAIYCQLEDAITDAGKRGNFAECSRLRTEQDRLGIFKPWITHSVIEGRGVIAFHPQLLTDFLTIEELAQKMLKELGP
jgi:hypothetical protein